MNARLYPIVAGTGLTATVLFIALLAGGAQPAPVTPEQLWEQAAEAERQDRTQQVQDLTARQERQQLIKQVRQTEQAFTDLLANAQSLRNRMHELLDSDDGKPIASDKVSVRTFDNLYNAPRIRLDEIREMTDRVSDLIDRLELADAGPDVGLPLDEPTLLQAEHFRRTFDRWSTVLEQDIATFNDILTGGPTELDLEQAPTLRQAVDAHHARWPHLLARAELTARDRTAEDTLEILAERYAEAERHRATVEGQLALENMRAQMDSLRQEHEREMLRQQEENAIKLADVQRQLADALAEIERLDKQATADRTVTSMQLDSQVGRQIDVAQRERLQALAKSLEVQTLLAPLLAHGYSQPYNQYGTYEQGPVSLSQLARLGALDHSVQGLRRFLDILTNPQDKERPRWAMSRDYRRLSQSQHDELRKAHTYLRELGPVMVELRMLAQ